jgi:hypothetical protein
VNGRIFRQIPGHRSLLAVVQKKKQNKHRNHSPEQVNSDARAYELRTIDEADLAPEPEHALAREGNGNGWKQG